MKYLESIAGGIAGGFGSALGGGIAGGILGGIGKLFGGGGPSQEELMQQQFEYQKQLMGLQAGYNRQQAQYSSELGKQMWDYTNYENQVQHLKNAGLNVGLMYGKSGGGGASAEGAGAAQGVGLPQAPNPLMALQWKQMNAQTDLMKSESAKNYAEAAKAAGAEIPKIKAETENIKELKKQIIAITRGAEAEANLKEFQTWLNDLKKNSTYYENGKGTTYEEAFIENTFKELAVKGIELDAEEKELLNRKGVAEKLAEDLDTLARGKFAEATERIHASGKMMNEKNKSYWEAERSKWELAQDKALSKLMDKIGADGDYAKLFMKILKYVLK